MSTFKVYQASAGSGKTFMLVRHYLQKILESPDNYRKILVVTFTNKAAAELKHRIFRELNRLAINPAESKYLAYLKEYFGRDEPWISEKAGELRTWMLHDYSRIQVSTIDSFFQQVLRAFARETGLASAFQVQLDTDLVLNGFPGYLFQLALADTDLLDWLTEWVNDRMDNQESWHKLESDLVRLGSELLKEEILVASLADPTVLPARESISELKGYCRRTIREFNDRRDAIAAEARQAIARNGCSVADFSYGKGGPAGTLCGLDASKDGPGQRARDAIDNPQKWVKADKLADPLNPATRLYPELNSLMKRAVLLFDSESRLYKSCVAVNRNLFALGLTTLLFDYFRAFFEENNEMLISLTQPIINQVIGGNPTPFIFEKTGTYLNHFLIDEFQDTSDLQWENFKPLLTESLSSGGLGMVVGDTKQSIYRWRNSNWKLLDHTAINDLGNFGLEKDRLMENHRSCQSVIDFNNMIFSNLPGVLMEALAEETDDGIAAGFIDAVYDQVSQKYGTGSTFPGRVEVRFVPKEGNGSEWKETVRQELPAMVEDLLVNKGYRQSDITFLVRKNADADQIIAFLAASDEYQRALEREPWSFISPDVFRIGANPAVTLIVHFLRYLANPVDQAWADFFQWDLDRRRQSSSNPDTAFRENSIETLNTLVEMAAGLDLLNLTDEIIRTCCLDHDVESRPYLLQFRDMVRNAPGSGSGSPSAFIEWWDAIGYKQVLAADNEVSAMRIMTIHKSKGLSSPVIIVPFCSWEFNHSNRQAPWLWVPTAGTPFNQVGMIPVKYSKDLDNSFFSGAYLLEKKEVWLDNLNLLYVAFTRTEQVLAAFCPFGNKVVTVGDALHQALAANTGSDGVFRMGDPLFRSVAGAAVLQQESELPDPILTGVPKPWLSKEVRFESPDMQFGNQMHRVLERIHTRDDLDNSLEKSVMEGIIEPGSVGEIRAGIMRLFEIPQVADWFSGKWQVMNEASILIPGTGERRPDRIMIGGGRVVVVDYKTGEPERRHAVQVREYAVLIRKLGYSDVAGYLLYIDRCLLEPVTIPEGSFQQDLKDQEV